MTRERIICEACNKPILRGQFVHCYEDVGEVHVNCDQPDAFSDDPMACVLVGDPMRRAALSRQEASGEVQAAPEPYRSQDAAGSPEAAETVGWNWINELADQERLNDPVLLEIQSSPLTGGGRVIALYRSTRLLACATIFRDTMNFAVLVRWQAPRTSAQPLADAGDVERRPSLSSTESFGDDAVVRFAKSLSTAPDELRAEGDVADAADGLDLVANALREVHALGRDGVDDAAFDASMFGQIAACERGAALLRRAALARPDRMEEMEGEPAETFNEDGLLPCPKCQCATGPHTYWWTRGQAWLAICGDCKHEATARESHEHEARAIWNKEVRATLSGSEGGR